MDVLDVFWVESYLCSKSGQGVAALLDPQQNISEHRGTVLDQFVVVVKKLSSKKISNGCYYNNGMSDSWV